MTKTPTTRKIARLEAELKENLTARENITGYLKQTFPFRNTELGVADYQQWKLRQQKVDAKIFELRAQLDELYIYVR